MKMYNQYLSIFVGTLFGIVAITPFIWILAANGTITIEIPYKEQLDVCSRNLELCQKDIPECPEVKCNCGASGIVWSVLGFLGYVFGLGTLFISHKKLKKEKKESNK